MRSATHRMQAWHRRAVCGEARGAERGAAPRVWPLSRTLTSEGLQVSALFLIFVLWLQYHHVVFTDGLGSSQMG